MKLYVATPTKQRPKHLVLVTRPHEIDRARRLIAKTIPRRPVLEHMPGKAIFRFHVKYLPKVALAMGDEVELSDKARDELYKQQNRHLPPMPEGWVPDGFRGTLWPYQTAGVWRMIHDPSPSLFLTGDMGTGKTSAILGFLSHAKPFPVLIAAPNNVKAVWKNEAKKFTPGLRVAIVPGSPASAADKAKVIASDYDVLVIHYEALRLHPELRLRKWGCYIEDEHHRVSGVNAKMTKASLKIKADRKIFASGTPSRNGRLEEMWSPLKKGWPTDWADYESFEARYVARANFGNGSVVIGYNYADEVTSFIRQHQIRWKIEEVQPDLPELIERTRYVDMTKDQARSYKEIRDEMLMWLDNGEKKSIPTILAKLTRLKQCAWSPELFGGPASSCKVDEVKADVEEIVAEGRKVVIFSQWSRATRILERELAAFNPLYIDGSVPTDKRTQSKKLTRGEICETFQTDPRRGVLIATIGALKEGVTLTAATHGIFTDLTWVPSDYSQAVKRMHRIGSRETVIATTIETSDTIETRIQEALAEKRRNIDFIVDGKMERRDPVKLAGMLKKLL